MRALATWTAWVILAGCASAPPPTSSPAPVYGPEQAVGQFDSPYFPFATGKRWVYNLSATINDQTHTGQVTWEVLEASSDRAKVQVTTTVGGQSQAVVQEFQKQTDGTITSTSKVEGQEPQTQTYDPRMMEPGLREEGPQGAILTTASDTVMTPAGAFPSVKMTVQLPENKGQISTWYAKDVGLVKTETQFSDQGTTGQTGLELVQY